MNLEALQEWLAHPAGRVALAAAILVAVVLCQQLALRLARSTLRRLARREHHPLDAKAEKLVSSTSPVLGFSLGLLAGSQVLELGPRPELWLQRAVVLVVLWQIGVWISHFILYMVDRVGRQDLHSEPLVVDTEEARQQAPVVVRLVAQVLVWSVVLLVALENLGVDVTALVAGLGIGGVAVALAVQNILGDLLASLSIVLDRPFEVGHFVIVGEDRGTVERIGLKTTRVRALSGQQIVFSNSDLLKSRIHNYRRMVERRVVQRLTLDFATTPEQLETVVERVRALVNARERVRYERFHFDMPGAHGFEFELVYWVDDPDFALHMDVKQDLLLQITRVLNETGVRYAVPVRRLVSDELGRPPAG